MKPIKILIVEDSERLRRSLGDGLTKGGDVVDQAADGVEGYYYIQSYDYDVVILDLMLTRLSGLEVLRRVGEQDHQVHVLILSARDQVEDRVRGLAMGADDYLVKPFDFGELCARLQALVRRRFQKKNPRLRLGSLVIETSQRCVSRDGTPIPHRPDLAARRSLPGPGSPGRSPWAAR